MLGSLKKAMGGGKYEKVTTSDEPMGVFAIDEDDDIDKLSQMHRDLVVQARAEIQEAESNVSQLVSERQQHEHLVRQILSEPSESQQRSRCCCRRSSCVIL